MILNKFESIYSKNFYTDKLNKEKYNIILKKAERIRDFKNKISNEVFQNFETFKNMSKFDFLKHSNQSVIGLVGQDIQNALSDVYTCYSNKFDAVLKKTKFESHIITPTYYQKNTTKLKDGSYKHLKGDFKSFDKKTNKTYTKLSKTLSYIAKYSNENTPNYLNKSLIELKVKLVELNNTHITNENEKVLGTVRKQTKNKINMYTDMVCILTKFGYDRLYNLAKLKNQNTYRRYNKKAIVFKSLSYRTTSRIKNDIVCLNKNTKSEIRAFITVGGFAHQSDDINQSTSLSFPVSFHTKYHGKLKDYLGKADKRGCINASYTMCIEKGRLRIVLTKDGERFIPIDGENVSGVDVNIKHNLFSTSFDETIDFDRDLIEDYSKFLDKLDETKKNKKKMGLPKEEVNRLSRQNQRKQDAFMREIKFMLSVCCSELVKLTKKHGDNHIVLEDIQKSFKSFSFNEALGIIKYSRLWSILHLGDLKHVIKSIAYKNEVCVSIVHAHYSSQQCSCCGYIDKGNRKTQEDFECLSCGMKMNADLNAAKNLSNRILLDVLRDGLLSKNEMGEYTPLILPKDKIKEKLETHHIIHPLSKTLGKKKDVLGCLHLG